MDDKRRQQGCLMKEEMFTAAHDILELLRETGEENILQYTNNKNRSLTELSSEGSTGSIDSPICRSPVNEDCGIKFETHNEETTLEQPVEPLPEVDFDMKNLVFEVQSVQSITTDSSSGGEFVSMNWSLQPSHEIQEQALRYKEEGNKYFKQGQWVEAIKSYTRAIEIDSTKAYFFGNRSACHMKLNDLQSAESDCSEALLIDPCYSKAYLRRGTIRVLNKQYHMAALDFQSAVICEPKNSFAYQEYLKAHSLWLRSEENLDLDNIEPTSDVKCMANALKQKGNELAKQMDWVSALQHYNEAAQINPWDPIIFCNRALCHMKLSLFREAKNDCTIAIGIDRNYSKAYYRRALAYEQIDDIASAVIDIHVCLKLDPHNTEVMATAQQLLQSQRLSKQVPEFEAPQLSEKDILSEHIAAGNDFYRLHNWEQALESFSLYISKGGGDAESYFKRGMCYVSLKRYGEAEEDLTKAVSMGENSTDLFMHRGCCRVMLGKFTDALEDYKTVLSKDPSNEFACTQVQTLGSHSKIWGLSPDKAKTCEEILCYFRNISFYIVPSQRSKAPLTEVPVHGVSGEADISVLKSILKPHLAIKPPKPAENKPSTSCRLLFNHVRSNIQSSEDPAEIPWGEMPPHPVDSTDFLKHWDSLRAFGSLKAKYLMKLDVKQLPTLFNDSIPCDIIEEMKDILCHLSDQKNEVVQFLNTFCASFKTKETN